MKRYVMGLGLLVMANGWAEGLRIDFDAQGNVLYDSRVVMDQPCEVRWGDMTCRHIAILEHLVKTTPIYQEGHFLRMEQRRQRQEEQQRLAIEWQQTQENEWRERSVRAQELQAQASWAQVRKPSVQIVVGH